MKKNLMVLVMFVTFSPAAFALGQNTKIENNWGKSECHLRLKKAQEQLQTLKNKQPNKKAGQQKIS